MSYLSIRRRFHYQTALLAVGLSLTAAVGSLPDEELSTLERIERWHWHLDKNDPRELPLKIRTLMLNENMFFRGTTDLFYVWAREHCMDWGLGKSPSVLLHGDVHLGNVGTYQTTGELGKDLGFGLVDLDEADHGPFQLDLLRATTALRFVVSGNKLKINDDELADSVKQLVEGYRSAISDENTEFGDFVDDFIKETKDIKLAKYISKYAEVSPEPKFHPCRMKNDNPADIMQPVEEPLRSVIVSAVWESFSHNRERATAVFAIESESQLSKAVKDMVRWTRVESSGSQGLHKYLLLIAVKANESDEKFLILELKQEPIPAMEKASRISLSRSRPPDVMKNHGYMFEPDPWFVGCAKFEDRGYLVRVKDAWGEELSDNMVKKEDDLPKFAKIMGKAIGYAHRNGMRTFGIAKTRAEWKNAAESLDEADLLNRSKAVYTYLLENFESLRSDPRAKAYAEKANEFIKNACPEKPKKEKEEKKP